MENQKQWLVKAAKGKNKLKETSWWLVIRWTHSSLNLYSSSKHEQHEIRTSRSFSSNGADLNTVKQSAVNHSGGHTAMLMNFQRQGWCPIVELAAECELSPRGEGANKTQHNTNKPPGQCEPASQPASRLGWQQSPLRKPARTMKSFMSWTGNRAAEHPIRTVSLVLSDHVAVIYLFLIAKVKNEPSSSTAQF